MYHEFEKRKRQKWCLEESEHTVSLVHGNGWNSSSPVTVLLGNLHRFQHNDHCPLTKHNRNLHYHLPRSVCWIRERSSHQSFMYKCYFICLFHIWLDNLPLQESPLQIWFLSICNISKIQLDMILFVKTIHIELTYWILLKLSKLPKTRDSLLLF